MSYEEQNAADELDQVIAARQAGRVLHPADSALAAQADFAGELIDATRAARLDPEFAALLESELNRQHPTPQATGVASLGARWQAWLGSFGLRLSTSGTVAAALTVFITVLSFAVFRFTQSAPVASSAPTVAPFIAGVDTPAAALPTVLAAAPSPIAPAITASASPEPTANPPQPSPTMAPAVTVLLATATPVPTRAAPLVTTPTAKPTATAASALISRTKVVMLNINGGGSGKTIGCGDTLVFVDRDITPTAAPLSAAIREQISIHEQYYGQSGLYNALYNSNLSFVSASIANGHATIYLSGTLRVGGVCDIPRVEAQLEETALQFSTVSGVTVYVNGIELHQAMSQK